MRMADRTYLAGEIASLTGAKKRIVLLWADGGAIEALPGTTRAGSGVHREFAWIEVEIAAVLAAIVPFRLSIGEMASIAATLRATLMVVDLLPKIRRTKIPDPDIQEKIKHFERIERARAGEPGVHAIFVPNTPENKMDFPAWKDKPFVPFIAGFNELPPYRGVLVADLGLCWKGLKT
jgi:hypothetical protein